MATNAGGSMVRGDSARSQARSLVPVVTSLAFLAAALFWAGLSLAASPPKSFPGLGPPGNVVALELYAGEVAAQDAGSNKLGAATLVGPDAGLQLVATTRFDSGQSRDVTQLARYTIAPAGIVEVDATGLVRPRRDGTATITATSPSDHRVQVRVTVQDFADPPPVNLPSG